MQSIINEALKNAEIEKEMKSPQSSVMTTSSASRVS